MTSLLKTAICGDKNHPAKNTIWINIEVTNWSYCVDHRNTKMALFLPLKEKKILFDIHTTLYYLSLITVV